MRKFLLGSALCAATTVAVPAYAAPVITFAPVMADGSTSATFSDTGIGSGAFNDVLSFVLPTGLVSSTISSIFTTNTSNNIDFTNVSLNMLPFTTVSSGQVEFRTLTGAPIFNGNQTLTISGMSGGNGSYSGTLSFTPAVAAAVPEPAAWLMMILGMGAVGYAMRRQKAVTWVRFAI